MGPPVSGSLSSMPPPPVGAATLGEVPPPMPMPMTSVPMPMSSASVHRHRHRCHRRIHSSVYAHWPVCTVYTLYSVYVQCTVYTLISVTIVYTVQCMVSVYTDQCMPPSSVYSGTMALHTHNVTVYNVTGLFIVQ